MIENGRTFLSVDGGGTGFRKAVISKNRIMKIEETGPLNSVDALLGFVNDGLSDDVSGISYAVAGDIIDHKRVVISPNLHILDGIDLASLTETKTGRRTIVCNDMEAATTGIMQMFPQLKYFMAITWSSGIGIRIVKDGKILSVSEGGHMRIDSSLSAPLCGCGKRGCAEARLGGTNFQETVRRCVELRQITIPPEYKWPSIFADHEADRGEIWAQGLYHELSFWMARFLSNLQTLLYLPAVVWKGGMAFGRMRRLEPEIRTRMREMLINPAWEKHMQFFGVWEVPNVQKDQDSLLGAAAILEKIF